MMGKECFTCVFYVDVHTVSFGELKVDVIGWDRLQLELNAFSRN